jgi:hypothetical protein
MAAEPDDPCDNSHGVVIENGDAVDPKDEERGSRPDALHATKRGKDGLQVNRSKTSYTST